jgi:site-specific recombinase XerC
MEFVQPIRDKKKIEDMKKWLIAQSPRDHLLFVLGINSGLRISDILKMKVENVLTEKRKPQASYELWEQKTGKTKKFPFGKNVQKAIESFLRRFSGEPRGLSIFFKKRGKCAHYTAARLADHPPSRTVRWHPG